PLTKPQNRRSQTAATEKTGSERLSRRTGRNYRRTSVTGSPCFSPRVNRGLVTTCFWINIETPAPRNRRNDQDQLHPSEAFADAIGKKMSLRISDIARRSARPQI